MGGATDIGVWNTPVHVVPPCILLHSFCTVLGKLARRDPGRPGSPNFFGAVPLRACPLAANVAHPAGGITGRSPKVPFLKVGVDTNSQAVGAKKKSDPKFWLKIPA